MELFPDKSDIWPHWNGFKLAKSIGLRHVGLVRPTLERLLVSTIRHTFFRSCKSGVLDFRCDYTSDDLMDISGDD